MISLSEPFTAAFIVLLHLCGPEAVIEGNSTPQIEADIFTVWSACSDRLCDVLRRDGGVIRCPERGTSYPPRAA